MYHLKKNYFRGEEVQLESYHISDYFRSEKIIRNNLFIELHTLSNVDLSQESLVKLVNDIKNDENLRVHKELLDYSDDKLMKNIVFLEQFTCELFQGNAIKPIIAGLNKIIKSIETNTFDIGYEYYFRIVVKNNDKYILNAFELCEGRYRHVYMVLSYTNFYDNYLGYAINSNKS